MKMMKNMLAVILALCLVMSLSVPAFATEVAETTTATTTATEPAASEPAASEPTASEPAASEPAAATDPSDVEEQESESTSPTHVHADGTVHDGAEHVDDTTTTGTTAEAEEESSGLKTVLIILEVIASIVLIAIVLMQSGKESGLSGALSGNSDSYMSKGGRGGMDKLLAKSTKWIALVWILLTLALCLI